MSIKKLFKDTRLYVGGVGILLVVAANVFGYVELPKKVEVLDKKQVKTKSNVEKLAHSVDVYVAEQKVYRAGQLELREYKEKVAEDDKRQMKEWINAVSKK